MMKKILIGIAFLVVLFFGWNYFLSTDKDAIQYEFAYNNQYQKGQKITLATTTPGASAGATIEWLLPIDQQLKALREKNIVGAYNESLSKEFKNATSLNDFISFINKYPIFFNHTVVTVKNQDFQTNEANVTVILDPEIDAIPVHYLLKKDDGKWKIWSMNIVPTYSEAVNALLLDPTTIRQTVEGFIQLLRSREVPKAFSEYTSKPFREKTTIDNFRKFIAHYPVLEVYDAAEFKTPTVEKTTGQVEVNLYDRYGTTTVEYTLGIEGNKWKIWEIRVIEQTPEHPTPQPIEGVPTEPTTGVGQEIPATTQSATSLDLEKVEVGTGLNLKGEIVDPSATLHAPHGDIYVNLFVRNGISRIKIDMNLEHIESHSAMPEVSTTLQQDGNSVLSFSFEPPPQGWPRGHYRIHVRTSTGVKRVFSFTIE